MTDSPAESPVLSAAETSAAESLLAAAPSYPALASPGEPLARLPRGWSSSD